MLFLCLLVYTSDRQLKLKKIPSRFCARSLNIYTIKVKENKLVSIKTEDKIRDGKVLVEMLNNHDIDIVEKSSGSAPKSIGNQSNPD